MRHITVPSNHLLLIKNITIIKKKHIKNFKCLKKIVVQKNFEPVENKKK